MPICTASSKLSPHQYVPRTVRTPLVEGNGDGVEVVSVFSARLPAIRIMTKKATTPRMTMGATLFFGGWGFPPGFQPGLLFFVYSLAFFRREFHGRYFTYP